MNRRKFFKMLAGVAVALAVPLPKALTNADIWLPRWDQNYWEGGGTSSEGPSIWTYYHRLPADALRNFKVVWRKPMGIFPRGSDIIKRHGKA